MSRRTFVSMFEREGTASSNLVSCFRLIIRLGESMARVFRSQMTPMGGGAPIHCSVARP